MVRETELSPARLVLPLFVTEGEGVRGTEALAPHDAQHLVQTVRGMGYRLSQRSDR